MKRDVKNEIFIFYELFLFLNYVSSLILLFY